MRVDTHTCDASGHGASKLVGMGHQVHIGLLLVASTLALGNRSVGQRADQNSSPPCTVVPQLDPCGSKSSTTEKKAPAEKFPFPGASTSQPDNSGPNLGGAPHTADPPAAPPNPGVSPARKFPFPGESDSPKGPETSTGTSSSSSSSSADGESNPADAASSPDAGDTPELKDKGSEGQQTLPGRHILHRVNPPGTKLQTPDERAAEDVNIARFYMDTGDFKAAYLRGADAVKLQPDDPSAHFALAEAAVKLNKRDEAMQHYEECLKLDPVEKEAKAAKKALARLQAQR